MPGEDVTKKVRSETSLEGEEESGYLPGGRMVSQRPMGGWAQAGCFGYRSDEVVRDVNGGSVGGAWWPLGTRAESRAEKWNDSAPLSSGLLGCRRENGWQRGGQEQKDSEES